MTTTSNDAGYQKPRSAMVDYLQLSRFLCLLLAAATAVGCCSAKVKVESARSATASDTDEAISSESQTAERARTEVQVELLHGQEGGGTTTKTPSTGEKGTTVIVNVHGGDVHFHEDQQRTTTEADRKTPQGSLLNTKIGCPSAYGEHGVPALTGSLTVWLLVGIAVALMLATVGRPSGSPMWEIVGLLVAAAIVLQFLPDTDSGFQLMPISPWLYSGWLSFCLSILSWLGFITAILIALTGCRDAPAAFSAVLLFSMGINLLLSFGG